MSSSSRFRPYRRFERINAIIALPLAALLVPLPVVAQTAPVVVAPGSGNTRTYTTPGANGVPVVDINTANAAGLSHNKFTHYNVPAQGLALNNAAPTQFNVPSQLAGTLTTNFNLKAPAGVILNEVVAPNASTIAGFTEIVGGKADLVVANPYGIAVKGGGFINTDRVTLATGTPLFAASGALAGLRITQGELTLSRDAAIEAQNGLNAANVSMLNLLARSVKIDGQLNAQDLVIATGAHDFDYASREAAANDAATGAAPAVALDSSAVGGMYANRIRLVATDAGVGVRMLGDVAATTDDLTVDAAGRVQLSNKIYAERDIQVAAAGGIAVSGTTASLTAKRDIALDAATAGLAFTDAALVAGRDLALTGASLTDTSASTPASANRFAIGALTLNATGAANVSGSSYGAGSTLALESGSAAFSNLATFYSGADSAAAARDLILRTTTGDLDAGNAQLQSPAALSLTADRGAVRIGASGSGAGVQATTNITLSGFTGISNAGNVTAGSDLALRSLNAAAPAAVTNSGNLIAGRALSAGAGATPSLTLDNAAAGVLGARTVDVRANRATNAGTVQGTQGVTFNISGALTNAADAAILTAGEVGRDVSIAATSLTNAGALQSTGALRLDVSGAVNNSGIIATQTAAQGGSDGVVAFNSGAFTNTGTLQSAGAATLNVGSRLDQSASGAILGGNTVSIQSGAGSFAISTAGRIQSSDALNLGTSAAPAALTQAASAVTLAGGALQARASAIDNAGMLQAADALTLDVTGALANRKGGAVLTAGASDKAIALNAASLTNAGQIQSTGAINATASGATDNSGTVVTLDTAAGGAARAIAVASDTIRNSGIVQSAGALDVIARATSGTGLTNSGTLAAAGAVKLGISSAFENQSGGVLATSDALALDATALTNAGTIQSAKALTATIANQIENKSGGLLLTAGPTPAAVALTSATLSNAGTLQSTGAFNATANTITNSGAVISAGTLHLKSATSIANSKLIQSTGALTLTTPQLLDNSAAGNILGGADVTLVSGAGAWDLANAGRIQSASTLGIGTSSGAVALTNAAGATVYSGGALTADGSTVDNSGTIRGTSGATFNLSSAFVNHGTGVVAVAGQPGAALAVTAASLANSGRFQSDGTFDARTTGKIENHGSGVILTASAADGGSGGNLATRSSTLSNAGTIQSAGAIELVATTTGTTSFANAGRVQAAQSITIKAPTRQQVSGTIIGGTNVVLRSDAGDFALDNSGTIQAGGDLSLGYFSERVDLANGGSAFAGGRLDVSATNVNNGGTLHAGNALSINATGAVNTSGIIASDGFGDITAASLTNSGRIRTNGSLDLTTSGVTTNNGTISTTSGQLRATASTLTNNLGATISSGSDLSITTKGSDAVTTINHGTIQSTGDFDLTAKNGILNSATGMMNGGGNVTIVSGGGDFSLTNAGTVQAGGNLTIGQTGELAAITNTQEAHLRAGGSLSALATTIDNAGTIQGAQAVTLNATGAINNAATGVILTTAGPAAHITAVAASIANAGQIQSTGAINATASGAITNAANGTWITTGTGSLNATGATITNSGAMQSGGTLGLVAATDLTNTADARIQSASDMSLTAQRALTNSGDVLSGRHLVVVGGSTAFDVINDGRMQSAQNFTFGSAGARATVTNAAPGVISAGGTLTGSATTLTNRGVLQSTGAMTLDATGAITNHAAARLLTTGTDTPATMTLTAASLTNAGDLGSTGSLDATLSGALANTGRIVTAGTADLTATAASIDNAVDAVVQSAGAMTLTTATTLANAGTLQATNTIALTTPTALTNANTGKIVSDTASITLSGGNSAFAITNSGRVQAAQDFTFGSTAARATVINNAANAPDAANVISEGVIQAGGKLAGHATTLVNHGIIQSTGTLDLNASDAVTNSAGAKLFSGDAANASSMALTAASFANHGDVQSRGAFEATLSGALTNTGAIATLGTGALTTTSANASNTGTIDSAGALAMTTNTTLTNSGTLKSVGALALTTPDSLVNQAAGKIASGGTLTVNGGSSGFTIDNSGLMQSGAAFTLGSTTARAALANAAGATVLSADTLTATTSTVTNTGTVQAGNTLAIDATSAITNNSAGKILTAGTAGRALSFTGASLTNVGAIQSTGAITATLSGTIDNSGTIATLSAADDGSDGALTATAGGALTNTGTIGSAGALTLTAGSTFTNAANATLRSVGDATLTTGTLFTNAANANVATDGNLAIKGTSAFALNNSGRIQSGGDLALGEDARRTNLDNATGATVRSGGDTTAFLSGFTNNGTVQIGGSGTLTLNSGVTLTNHAAGKLLAADALTIDTSGGNFGLTNAGLIQSGGLLKIGAAGRTATINQTSTSAKLFADTFAIHAGAVTNKGMIMGLEGGTLHATSFLNDGSGSRFIASTGSGATTVTLTGTLTNQGAIHAGGNLTLNAATIDNTSTGGISSLEALTLNASEDIINRSNGALYSGGKMTLIAGDDVTNHEDATIDTDGDFAVTATSSGSRFLNQGQINIGGSATITARTFDNIMAGAENISRVWKGLPSSGSTINQHNYKTGSDAIPNVSTSQWYYTGNSGFSGGGFSDRKSTISGYFYEKQEFVGISDPNATFGNKTKPQISATNLTIDGFDSGRNVGGLLTATGTLAIRGRTSGSSFLNDALTLEIQKWKYTGFWSYDYSVWGDYDWNNPSDGIEGYDTAITQVQDYFSIGAGLRAGNLSIHNVGTLTLLGSANPANTQEKSASGGSMEGLGGAASVSGPVAANSGSAVAVSGTSLKVGSSVALVSRAASANGATSSALGASGSRDAAIAVGPRGVLSVGGLGLRGTVNVEGAELAGANGFNPSASSNPFDVANQFTAASGNALAALKGASVAFNGLSLKLPSNPNGLFVPNADPHAKFLVGVNSTFGIDPSSATGSDELFKQLGVNPDILQKRLGDASYETYLVRQQLVDQLGSKFLSGQKNEAAQMQTLMANAAAEASRLGLQIGQAPTPAQLAALGRDMVWMVEQVVGGQRVLVPQVYLSAKTRGLFDPTNSTLAANNVDLDVGDLTNTGGSISGSDTLNIKAKGDITNLSGSISGGDVKLDAGGSIRNETLVRGDDNSSVLGKTAGITSTGTMDLSAGKDIRIIGADVKAGGDASLSAGGEIVVDTVQKKTTTTTTTTSEGFFSGSSTTTTTSEVKNQASNLDIGGNLKIKSGGDTTLAGSNLNVKGDLDTDIQGDLNILARQDQKTVETKSSQSGFGVGGGLYGSQTTTTNDFTGTNVGSTLNVGGNANLNTANTLTVEGSNLNIKGDATITAKDVQVLDGKDERRTTTETTTTTIGVFTDSGTKSDANAKGDANAFGASGSAKASGSANGEVTIGARVEIESRTDYESKSKASNLNIGGNLKMNVENDVTLRGSNIDAKGDVDVNAKNINLLAGQDVKTSTTNTATATVGLYVGGSGSGEASASGSSAAGYGEAGAKGEAEVGAGLKTQFGTSSSSSGSTTARTSGISGGNVNLNAENKITEEGARLDAGNNLTLSATELESRAAANKTWSSSSSDTITNRTGVYADAQGSATAGGVEGTAAGGSVSAGVKTQVTSNSTSSSNSSSTAVTSTYNAGNLTLNIKDKASLEGTQMNASGNVDITAGSLDYKAAKNTSTSSSDELNLNAELKLGVGAGGSVDASGKADGGYGVTGKGKLGADGGSSGSSSSTAVVGGINGGTINIKTTQGDVNLEGTNLKSTGDTTVDAKGNLNFTEARNTSSTSQNNYNGEIKAEVGSVNNEVEGKGGYAQKGSSSDTAVTGGINSGGTITLKSGGDTTLVGADLNSGGDTTVDAKGSVNLKQATSTSSSTEFNVQGEAKIGEGGGHVKASGGYETTNSSTADTANINSKGNIKITSGTDTNIQGSNIGAGGTVDVDAGGKLNVTAKEESSSSFNASASGGFGAGGTMLQGNLGGSLDNTKTGATISGGNGVNLTSGKGGTTLEATQISSKNGDVNVTSQGTVTQKTVTNTSVSGSIGGAIGNATKPGLTDLSLDANIDTQKTSITSGGGRVNVQSGIAAPKQAPALKPGSSPAPTAATIEVNTTAKPASGGLRPTSAPATGGIKPASKSEQAPAAPKK